MSTQGNLLLDAGSYYEPEQQAPRYSAATTEPEQAGTQGYRRPGYSGETTDLSKQSGIAYIDQTVGGYAGVRNDALAGPVDGPVGRRPQEFDGSFINRTTIVADRVQGDVGRARRGSQALRRAVAVGSTQLPDDSRVIAAFTNPALSRVVEQFRRGDRS